jgi:hypothetical protein
VTVFAVERNVPGLGLQAQGAPAETKPLLELGGMPNQRARFALIATVYPQGKRAYSGSTIVVTGEDDSDGAFPQEKTHLAEPGWGTVIVEPLYTTAVRFSTSRSRIS